MRNLAIVVAVSCLTGSILAAGCGSSSTGTSSSATSLASSTGNVSSSSSGTASPTSSATTGSSSSGAGGSTGTGGSTGSGGPCYTDPTGYTALTASPTPKVQANACASTDISTFISDCITGSANCNDWFAANVAGEGPDGGGAGTACGNCIFPADSMGNITNAGATFSVIVGSGSSQTLVFGPNYGACIQLKDTTNGAACALALDNTNACEQDACDFDGTSQCSASDFQTCATFVTGTGGPCHAAAVSESACATDEADGGAAQICSPGGGNDQATDFTYIINLICGAG